ncbi:hypothetical protein ACU4GD_30625 [Cupriavidus basilensis]
MAHSRVAEGRSTSLPVHFSTGDQVPRAIRSAAVGEIATALGRGIKTVSTRASRA